VRRTFLIDLHENPRSKIHNFIIVLRHGGLLSIASWSLARLRDKLMGALFWNSLRYIRNPHSNLHRGSCSRFLIIFSSFRQAAISGCVQRKSGLQSRWIQPLSCSFIAAFLIRRQSASGTSDNLMTPCPVKGRKNERSRQRVCVQSTYIDLASIVSVEWSFAESVCPIWILCFLRCLKSLARDNLNVLVLPFCVFFLMYSMLVARNSSCNKHYLASIQALLILLALPFANMFKSCATTWLSNWQISSCVGAFTFRLPA